MKHKIIIHQLAFFAVTAVLFSLNISFGSTVISPRAWFSAFSDTTHSDLFEILWQFRLTKAVTCVLAGGALAVGGLMMQTLFRNPLAGPDVLGLSSGASLLVALVLTLGNLGSSFLQQLSLNSWGLATAATLGSSVVFLLLISLSRIIRDNTSLLLTGLMVSATVSSVVGMLQFISQANDLQLFLIWSLGNVGGTNWKEIGILFLLVLAGISIFIAQVKSLNGRLLGDTYAKSLGIKLDRSRFWIVFATSMITGGVTAFCGPIAFVGLAVPHFVRLMVPLSDHRQLLPLVLLGGSSLLLFCDWVAHLWGSLVLPLNVVTSLIGAPLVIWMILKNKKVTL
ncbi:MAG: iron chelate uptake ABC transporter family permease subunit [Cytophagales bacterium]